MLVGSGLVFLVESILNLLKLKKTMALGEGTTVRLEGQAEGGKGSICLVDIAVVIVIFIARG